MLKKSCFAFLLVVSYLSFLVSGCKNFLASSDSDFSTDEKFASLEIVPSEIVPAQSASKSSARALDLSENGVCYAVVSISGTGISALCSSDYVQVSGGKGSSVVVKNIPVGKNRIVTVQGYDKDKNAVNGAVIRNITDISQGSNSCSVTQSTTALGNVFNSLLAKNHNLNSLEKTDIEKIKDAIDSSKSWALIDTAKIASDYISGSISGKTSYYVSTGTVNIVNETSDSSYLIKILDPSSPVTNVGSGTQISDSAPGVWSVQLLDSSKNILASASGLKVISGKTSTVTVEKSGSADLSGKTIVFVKASSAPSIWAWEDGGVALSNELGETWEGSGSKMSAATNDYMANPDGWFMKDFSSVATGKTIKFKLNWSDNEITGKAGTFWYDGSSSSSENPSPVSASGDVSLKIENPFDSSDGITVHAKYKYIYIWNSGSTTLDKTCQEMKSEGDGWYYYEIPAASASIIFKDVSGTGDGDWTGKTDNLSRSEKGEWWYSGGKWYDGNPDKPSTPKVKASVASGTYLSEQTVTLSSSNSSDVIYYTLDGSVPTAFSQKYTSAIKVSSSLTLKAIGYNEDASPQFGEIVSFEYVIDPDADLEPPVIVPSKEPGRYTEETSVSFTFTDNKGSSGVSAYYTTDNSTPTASSSKYTGQSIRVEKDKNVTIRILAVDEAGNETKGTYYYSVGDAIQATRWDPRQESIYFLLTARWFDGDSSNTVGDQWCSTEDDPTWRGDFKGLVEKMDYIKALGFTCIWITPIVQNRGPLCYHGYHAWDMYKEDARLVSEGYDFQRVIDEAHARGMKICLDVVLQHSGRFGLKDFAEIKYNRDPNGYPVPVGWEGFTYDEDAYEKAYSVADKTGIASVQKFPNGWEYDGLKSPGKYPSGWSIDGVDVGGQDIPPYADFVGDVRPFTAADNAAYSYLQTGVNAQGLNKYQWPTTESYQLTIDTGDFSTTNGSATANYTYEQYCSSPKLHLHGWSNGFNDSGMFDKYPDANLRSIHEDCPDLNTESKEVQEYVLGAYKRYIDMGVDMFRVDTLMHIDKKTVNDVFWPEFFKEAATEKAKAARGGGDFFVFGEVANFVCNLGDKPAAIRQYNYTYSNDYEPDISEGQTYSSNSYLDGNSYRTIDKTKKAVPESDYVVSTIDIISHNNFCNGETGGYGKALSTSGAYWDSTYLTWYAESHDYGPNKYNGRYTQGEYAPLWSMLFTFRGIPIVYYGNEINFKKNCGAADWPGSTKNSLESTGRAYYGENLEGTVTASDFGKYEASGTVATTLSSNLSKHLRDLNRLRSSIPALQMGQFSTEGHSGGWAGYKRRYTGTNKITGESVDSYVLVGVGSGSHTFTGVLDGTYVDAVSGGTMTVSGGNATFTAHGSDNAALGVWVLSGLATPAPGKVCSESPYLGF